MPKTLGRILAAAAMLCLLASAALAQAPARIVIANASSTGTSLNHFVKLTGAPSTAVVAATTDTSGIIGVCIANCGTSGNAVIQTSGLVSVAFDGATTAGHYVQNSGTTGGDGTDAGSTYPSSNEVLGRVLSTHGAGGTYSMDLFGPEISATAGSIGSVTCSNLPALTGDTTTSAGSCATTTAKINGTAFSGTNGDAVKFGASNTPADSGLAMPSAAGSATVGQLIASGTAAMGTGAISSGTCASVVTVSATGVATTDAIIATPNADPTGVTGYAPASTGSLYIWAYPTSGNVNFKVCNNTGSSITPSALTLNWRVIR